MRDQTNRKQAFMVSLALHSFIFLVLIVSFHFSSPPPVWQTSLVNGSVLKATVMSLPLPAMPSPKPKVNKPVAKPLPALPKPKPVQTLVKPDVAVKPTPIAIQPKPEAIAIKKSLIKPLKKPAVFQDADIEKQLLADIKTDKASKAKKQHKALESAFAAEVKELNAKSIQKQMLDEQQRMADMHAEQVKGVVDKYKALVLQAISQHWLLPANIDKSLSAELMIRIAPGGTVLEVELIKSSGNPVLDRSARSAVFNASPLPVPSDSEAFNSFRQFMLKVKPENILSSDSWV